MARASLIQATWRLQEGTRRFRQQACVTAETSGPAFLKPHWVCSKEGPTSAHRLRATKKGRERNREGGRDSAFYNMPCPHNPENVQNYHILFL